MAKTNPHSPKSIRRRQRRAGPVIQIDPTTGKRVNLTEKKMRENIKKMHEAKAAKAAAKKK